LAVGALILAASVSTIFLLFSVETIHADGIVVSSKGIIAVRQKKLGIVQRVDVTEGQKVSVGDRLLLVASDRADEENNSELTSRRLIKDLDEKFLIQKKEIISEELRKKILISQSVIDVIAHDKTKSELMLENVLKRKRALELSRERYQKIAEKGYISDAQLAERELEFLSLENQEIQVQRDLLALQQKKLVVESEVASLQAELAAALADKQAGDNALQKYWVDINFSLMEAITSPINGTILAVTTQPGQYVQTGELLVSILPDGASPQIALFVAGNDIGSIAVGSKARAEIDVFRSDESPSFDGTISSISRLPLESNSPSISVYGISPEMYANKWKAIVATPPSDDAVWRMLTPGFRIRATIESNRGLHDLLTHRPPPR